MKPLLGIMPINIWIDLLKVDIEMNGGMHDRYILENRIEGIKRAIERYKYDMVCTPIEWRLELEYLQMLTNKPEYPLIKNLKT